MKGIKKIRLSKFDKLWSKLTRGLTPFCWYCKTPLNLNAHHFIRRSVKSTRLDLMNSIVLCSLHHVFSSEFSAHKTPEKFERWFKKEYRGHWDYLRKQAQKHMTEREAIKIFCETNGIK